MDEESDDEFQIVDKKPRGLHARYNSQENHSNQDKSSSMGVPMGGIAVQNRQKRSYVSRTKGQSVMRMQEMKRRQ